MACSGNDGSHSDRRRPSKFFCELTHSAYFRYLHDQTGKVCAAKHVNESRSNSEMEELDWSVSYSPFQSLQHDSTFNFGTESEESNDENIGNSNYEVNEGRKGVMMKQIFIVKL